MLSLLGVAVLLAGIGWLIRRPGRTSAEPDDRDPEALANAEAEVRDVDALATPEDARDDLPDWGPGTPR